MSGRERIVTSPRPCYRPEHAQPTRRVEHVAVSHPFCFESGGGPASLTPPCGVASFALRSMAKARARSLSVRRAAALPSTREPSANPLLPARAPSCQAGRGRVDGWDEEEKRGAEQSRAAQSARSRGAAPMQLLLLLLASR